jgi:Tol biopolymer transport system component
MKTTNKKILSGLLALVIIGAGAYLVDRYVLKNSTGAITQKPAVDDLNSKVAATPSTADTSDKIVYLQNNNDAKEVVVDSAAGGAAKVLFTDQDEDQKIQVAADIAYLSREVLLFSGNDTSGKLLIVKLDGSGNKEVINDFSEPLALAVSPDGQKIAYVIFSNVESSYGNNIVIANRKGENRRVLFNTQDTINDLAFSEDGSELIFAKTNADGKSAISILSLDTPKENVIYQGDSNIPTLAWSKSGQIIFTLADAKFTSSSVFLMNESGGNLQKILETKNGVASFPSLSSDLLDISYLAATYQGKFATGVLGDVKVSTAKGQNITKISSGIQVLGWLP